MKKLLCAALAFLLLVTSGCKPGPSRYAAVSSAEATKPETLPTESETPPERLSETIPETAPETEPETTEAPKDQIFTLSFVGDLTLASDARLSYGPYSFNGVVDGDYSYPLKNVASYFQDDDLTLGNMEGVIGTGGYIIKEGGFSFKCDPRCTEILTQGGVDVLSLANNHIRDYGTEGLENTEKALLEAGLVAVKQNESQLVTTESGLRVGVIALFFQAKLEVVQQNVAALRQQGAELVVVLIHWGSEMSYRPHIGQEEFGRQMIDAGVDIVCGSHPHVLQKIEDYQGGAIYYSLGNFCFGGNHYPSDMDTAIIRQQVIRHPDGSIQLGERTIVPCCVSSLTPRNNFQPTPYPQEHEAYQRVLDKLNGNFTYTGIRQTYPW